MTSTTLSSLTLLLMSALGTMENSVPLDGIELWRGLHVGMSKDDVKNALPSKEVDLIADCRVKVSTTYDQAGRLKAVVLMPKWILSKNQCAVPIFRSLEERYGQPTHDVLTNPRNQFMPAEGFDLYQWARNGVDVQFKVQIGGKKWSLVYEPSIAPPAQQRIGDM